MSFEAIDLSSEAVCADCGATEFEPCRPGCGEAIGFVSAELIELAPIAAGAEFNAMPTAETTPDFIHEAPTRRVPLVALPDATDDPQHRRDIQRFVLQLD